MVGFTTASLIGQSSNPADLLANASLGAPTLAAPAVSGTGASATVSLSWTVPAGDPANQWIVSRGAGGCPPGSFATIATVSVESYTDTPGAAGTYCYEIQSELGNWTSQLSNQQTVTVSPTLPALVQKAHNESGGAVATISATFASSPAQNHLLVAIVGTSSSVTINQPAGWSSAINQSGAPGQAIFYKIAGAAESATVTVTTGSSQLGIQIYEYSGVATASPLDQTGSSTGTSSSPASGSATTTQAIELLLVGEVIKTNRTLSSWSNSFAQENDNVNGAGPNKAEYGGADRIVQSTGTYSTTATAGASAAWRGQIATFKAAP